MKKLRNMNGRSIYSSILIHFIFTICFISCRIEIPQSRIVFKKSECRNFYISEEDIQWSAKNPKEENQSELFVPFYNDIIKKYIASKIKGSKDEPLDTNNKIKLNLQFEGSDNQNLFLDILSVATLNIIPNSADITYGLSGTLIDKNGKEVSLGRAFQKSKRYFFLPLFVIQEMEDDKELPPRTMREFIDSFLETSLNICE